MVIKHHNYCIESVYDLNKESVMYNSHLTHYDFSQTLSLHQSPSCNILDKKTSNKRGRKSKSTNSKDEIEVGIQSTLEEKLKII